MLVDGELEGKPDHGVRTVTNPIRTTVNSTGRLTVETLVVATVEASGGDWARQLR